MNAFASSTFDLSSFSALDNQAVVTIRVYAYASTVADRTGRSALCCAAGTFRHRQSDGARNFGHGPAGPCVNYPAIGLSVKSGTAFTPTYGSLTLSAASASLAASGDLSLSGTLALGAGKAHDQHSQGDSDLDRERYTQHRLCRWQPGRRTSPPAPAWRAHSRSGTPRNYSPVDVTFASVSGAGNLLASAALTGGPPASGFPPTGSGLSQTSTSSQLDADQQRHHLHDLRRDLQLPSGDVQGGASTSAARRRQEHGRHLVAPDGRDSDVDLDPDHRKHRVQHVLPWQRRAARPSRSPPPPALSPVAPRASLTARPSQPRAARARTPSR